MQSTKLQSAMNSVHPTPSRGFLKIAEDLHKYEAFANSDIEKTAEISAEMTRRERDILEAFYKEAFVGQLARAGWEGLKAGQRGLTSSSVSGVGNRLALAGKSAKSGFQQAGGGEALQAGKQAIGRGLSNLGSRLQYQAPIRATPRSPLMLKAAHCMIDGSIDLIRANNLNANIDDYTESLEKLATVGALNFKLQGILLNPEISDSLKDESIKLGHENNVHCFELLRGLVKEAAGSQGYSSATKAIAESSPQAGNPSWMTNLGSKIKGAFSGGGASLRERGGTVSKERGMDVANTKALGRRSFGGF